MSESYAVHHVVAFVVHQFELDVLLSASYDFACTVIVDPTGTENGAFVARPEGCKPLELLLEAEVYILKVEIGIDVEAGFGLLIENMLGYVGFEAASEFGHVLYT